MRIFAKQFMNLPNMIHFKRNHLLVLGLALLIGSSCQRSDKLFRLEGKLENITGNELYLFGTQKPFDRIDTIRLEKGRFIYETEMDTLIQLTLLFNEGKTLPLFADKGLKVSIEGDATLPDSLQIKGGEANEELNQFKIRIRNMKDSVQLLAEADSFIRKHPFSQVSVYLLNKYFVQTDKPDFKRINTLIESMSGMLHDQPLIQSVQKRLDYSIKSDTGRYVSSFRIKNLKGDHLTSYHFRDKVLVLLFWATWSKPSLELQKELKTLQKKLTKEDIAFVFISLDMDKKRWKDTVKNDTIVGEQVCDGDGWESSLVKQFGVEKLPTAVLMTPQRKIVTKSSNIKELTAKIETLLKQEKERKNKLKKK